jgi:hypothetical protein
MRGIQNQVRVLKRRKEWMPRRRVNTQIEATASGSEGVKSQSSPMMNVQSSFGKELKSRQEKTSMKWKYADVSKVQCLKFMYFAQLLKTNARLDPNSPHSSKSGAKLGVK